MELLLTGFGVIACMLTWHYAWRPCTLDAARDRLFDLRDQEVRGWFIRNGVGLDHPVYKALRDLLNGMLKNTESLTFTHVAMLIAWSKEHADIDSRRRQEIEKLFQTDDHRIDALVKSVREKASMIMLDYVVESSPFAMVLALLGIVGIVAFRCYNWVRAAFSSGRDMSPALRTRFAAALLSVATLTGLTSRASAQATVEEKALSVYRAA